MALFGETPPAEAGTWDNELLYGGPAHQSRASWSCRDR